MTETTANFISQLGLSAVGLTLLIAGALLFSSYIKVVTILGVLRAGMGFYGIPSSFVTGGLALVLTLFIMSPTVQKSAAAIDAKLRASGGAVSDQAKIAAVSAGMSEWKYFLKQHARAEEVSRFVTIAGKLDQRALMGKASAAPAHPGSAESTAESWRVLAPAFLVSELRSAFAAALTIFLPFLVIELIVANILVAVGLERLSPSLVSFPLKLLLFVLLDGWSLIVGNIVSAYA